MTLENINLNYKDSIFSAFADDIIYDLFEVSEMIVFKNSLEQDYQVIISQVISQITFDQSLSEPRLLLKIEDDAMLIITLNDLELNFPDTFLKYKALEVIVIEQINSIPPITEEEIINIENI
jgi:hypothetical protein